MALVLCVELLLLMLVDSWAVRCLMRLQRRLLLVLILMKLIELYMRQVIHFTVLLTASDSRDLLIR